MSQSIPTTVTINPSSFDLVVGQTKQLSVTVRDQHGQPYSGPLPVTYTSHTSGIATISAGGLMHALTQGTAAIQVSCGNASGGTFPNIRI